MRIVGLLNGCAHGGVARQEIRFRRACVAVGLAVALLAALSTAEASARQKGAAGDAQAAVSSAGFDAVMRFDSAGSFTLPGDMSAFESEFFPLEGVQDIRCSLDAHILGYSQQGNVKDVLDALSESLENVGWARVRSESSSCRSFSKSAGTYRWAFVSAAQVGESVSVVVQWSDEEGGGA